MTNDDFTPMIESDIPIPASRAKYFFQNLKVGNSVFYPGKSPKDLSGPLHYCMYKHGIKLVCRTVVDSVDGEMRKGSRVWRTE